MTVESHTPSHNDFTSHNTHTTFELLKKMQNTYYIIVRTDKGDISVNHNFDALKIEGFTQEIDFTFLKEVSNLPVKKSKLLVDHKITIN